MSEKKYWSNHDVLSLISKWELYPELWDVSNESYRNRLKKQNALKNLATIFETAEYEINRKFHNLRTQYHHELRRIQEKKSADDTYQSSWEYFDAMKFISCKRSNKRTSTNLVSKFFIHRIRLS